MDDSQIPRDVDIKIVSWLGRNILEPAYYIQHAELQQLMKDCPRGSFDQESVKVHFMHILSKSLSMVRGC